MWQLARAKHIPVNKDYNYRSSKMRNCFGSIMGKMKIIRRQIRADNEEKRRYFQLHKSYYVCFYVTKIAYKQAGTGIGMSDEGNYKLNGSKVSDVKHDKLTWVETIIRNRFRGKIGKLHKTGSFNFLCKWVSTTFRTSRLHCG